MDDQALTVVCGKPSKKNAATTTRFVLPFAYQLSPINHVMAADVKEELYYSQLSTNTNDDQEEGFHKRRSYFTKETCKVLFERAEWYRIAEKSNSQTCTRGWDDTQWNSGVSLQLSENRKISASLLSPTIILFESNTGQTRETKNDGITNLQTGFLILDLFFHD